MGHFHGAAQDDPFSPHLKWILHSFSLSPLAVAWRVPLFVVVVVLDVLLAGGVVFGLDVDPLLAPPPRPPRPPPLFPLPPLPPPRCGLMAETSGESKVEGVIAATEAGFMVVVLLESKIWSDFLKTSLYVSLLKGISAMWFLMTTGRASLYMPQII